jgi:hypothetical protein
MSAKRRAPTARETRSAASQLERFGLRGKLNGRLVAGAAKELGADVRKTLRLLAVLKMGGQGLGPSPETTGGQGVVAEQLGS